MNSWNKKNATTTGEEVQPVEAVLHLVKACPFTFYDDYVVVDTETMGFSPEHQELIEIAALRVRDGEVVDEYSSLIKPEKRIPPGITHLTGITNKMVSLAPPIDTVLSEFLEFVGGSLILGHNIGFDMRFIVHNTRRVLGRGFDNPTADTCTIVRKLLPRPVLPNHKLGTVIQSFNIHPGTYHRALADCETTHKVYQYLKTHITKTQCVPVYLSAIRTEAKSSPKSAWGGDTVRARDIIASDNNFDTSHPIYGKKCVLSGEFTTPTRRDLMQSIVDIGGRVADNVTRDSDILILGFSAEQTTKQTKAQDYNTRATAKIELLTTEAFLARMGTAAPQQTDDENDMPF